MNRYQKSKLEPHEQEAVKILSQYFCVKVEVIPRVQDLKTPDFKIKGMIWELKSPTGSGKRTIQNNLRDGDKQSQNIILDLSRCKLYELKAIQNAKHELNKATKIKRLIIITKGKQILEIK